MEFLTESKPTRRRIYFCACDNVARHDAIIKEKALTIGISAYAEKMYRWERMDF